MMSPRTHLSILSLGALLLALPACGERSGSVPEVPASELAADVPALDSLHEVMSPLWHEAFPAKDYQAIQELVPQFDAKLQTLDTAQLPGILQDKQPVWDEQKHLLFDSYESLKTAAETNDEPAMLAYTETFHMNYEGLVRVIRPVVPELETFHQHLYGLYHYYGPGYDLEKIRSAADAMAADLPALEAAQLPENLSDRQDEFTAAVANLGEQVMVLQNVLKDPNRPDVEEAVENVHQAYSAVEDIFG